MRNSFVRVFVLALLGACASPTGDPASNNGVPPVGGTGSRIRDITDPSRPGHANLIASSQAVSGAIVLAVDTFDETHDGKGVGNVLIEDIDASKDRPFGGIGLFAPSFLPGNLRVSPGDVLDLHGQYQENRQIPSNPPVVFAPGSVLPQLATPIVTFRYETHLPEPVDIAVEDLTDFAKGRRWIGMLVRIRNATAVQDPFVAASGRVSIDLTPRAANADNACKAPFPKPAQLVNDLTDLTALPIKAGQTIKSVTGIVGFFCNLKIAPRSLADIQL